MAGCITLVGMMGAGKTAIGAELGRRLGRPFRDSDVEIETAAVMTIPEIFTRDGEAFFRNRETEVIGRLLLGGPIVLATGGGAWLRADNRQAIRRAGVAVWLDVDVDTLWQRLRGRSGRPLLETENPRQTLVEMLATRRPVYAKACLAVPVGPADNVDTTTRAVLDAIAETRPELLERL